ncbi:MAG: hypothetical protein APR62_12460 [Smithella sp. SDB]|nr:MAG: hypothetical protein APR62_12460 [Smithella sp. SDB]
MTTEARAILENIIEDFNPDKFVHFFRRKSKQFSPSKDDLRAYNDENFANTLKLGEIKFADADRLIVCAFAAQKPLTERSGKKAQYEKAKKIIEKQQIYAAGIFIFYDQAGNFRFSLIYPEYAGRKREWPNFRRFTYFVSNELTNKTFLQRIAACDDDFTSLDKIKEAFSVDKVTNKFFEEFRVIFEKTKVELEQTNKNTVCLWLKDHYDEEEYKEQINKFAYTFLGRLVFLYFLLRKGWIEDKKNYIRNIIEDKNTTNVYMNFFQPLFFDVFAQKENERPAIIKEQYKNTPYLNGGLFEKSEMESEMEKAGKFILFSDKFIRSVILDFFEAYNFTIDENSPDDQEVSIDPEMLGKVFENTLAEEERGKKGTFYTPREIVHYMVKSSLFQFLLNETEIKPAILHDIIYHEEANLDVLHKDQIRLLDSKLENIKVLDPAVGSAAFPVEMMQVLVRLRKLLNVKVGKNINEVTLKKQFIKNNLYGVDIDPGAIEIAKLRLWLALIVDYDKNEAEPLPNLDFQFRTGNSLQERIDDMDIFKENISDQQILFSSESEYEKMKIKMIGIKDKFYISDNEQEKKKLKKEFDNLEHGLIQAVLKKHEDELKEKIKHEHFVKVKKQIDATIGKIKKIEQKIKDGTYKLFKPDFHFSEVFDRVDKEGAKIGGFDIVIGNPPYGVKVDDDIKEQHKLGSRDSYGVFISTALKRFLKTGGVLSYIVSDTWLTIKTHKPLRVQVLDKQLHKIIRLHQDCFEATVNPCIMSLTNMPDNDGLIIAADLTNISTRKEIEELRKKIYHLNDFRGQSTPKFAVYEYKQDLIKTNSNMPIFVGSPKLFALMNDTDCRTQEKEITGQKVKIRQIKLNGKIVELIRFGDIADVKVGLQTGDNHFYLFQNPEARGSYRNINDFKKYLLTDKDLANISGDEKIRLKAIDKGFHKTKSEDDFDEILWFGGRYIIPYDKGGESDTETGWLPNYYVPTNYYVDWSQEAVERMKTLTIKKRDGKGDNKVCSRFQNVDLFFTEYMTYSRTGVYAPTFRQGSGTGFDTKSNAIFISKRYLGNLNSKMFKYIYKNFVIHTVQAEGDPMLDTPFIDLDTLDIVNSIISNQKKDPRYDYMSNEQKEIDRLVYEMYGLNDEDIREVETWYARRYPKLARFCQI